MLEIVREPESIRGWDLPPWDVVLKLARANRLLPRLACILDERGLIRHAPERVRPHIEGGLAIAAEHARVTRWEVACLRRVLSPLKERIVLLKGAAYLMAGLPPARGRLHADVDILVPESVLSIVESALLSAGWGYVEMDPYDHWYFRNWLHELPPLRHAERGTVLDVHYAILPRTSRLNPDAAAFIESAEPLDGGIFCIPSPEDMVLHGAAHMFQDGEIGGALRDLIDIDDLLRHFGARPAFWHRLAARARRLKLMRPLFYGLRYAQSMLRTPVPAAAMREAACGAPLAPVVRLMDGLVNRALILAGTESRRALNPVALLAVSDRAHWSRMPLHLFVRHVFKKASRICRRSEKAGRAGDDVQHPARR